MKDHIFELGLREFFKRVKNGDMWENMIERLNSVYTKNGTEKKQKEPKSAVTPAISQNITTP